MEKYYGQTRRPLVTGRIPRRSAVSVGVGLVIGGVFYLAFRSNTLTGAHTLLTSVVYLFVYTLWKAYGLACTAVGPIPGAMPVVLGWTGIRMLAVVDGRGHRIATEILLCFFFLVAVSAIPYALYLSGVVYLVFDAILGIWLCSHAIRLCRALYGLNAGNPALSRALLRATIIYLPLALGTLVVNRFIGSSTTEETDSLISIRMKKTKDWRR